jgi:hypothetical protein
MSDEILPLKWRAITRLLLLTSTNEGRRTPRAPMHQRRYRPLRACDITPGG